MANLVSMDSKKERTIGARVDEQTFNLLKHLAKKDKRTMSFFVGEVIIDEWLKMKGYKSEDKKTANGK